MIRALNIQSACKIKLAGISNLDGGQNFEIFSRVVQKTIQKHCYFHSFLTAYKDTGSELNKFILTHCIACMSNIAFIPLLEPTFWQYTL